MPLRLVRRAQVPVVAVVEARPLPATPPAGQPFYTWTSPRGEELVLSSLEPVGIKLGGTDSGRSIIGLDLPPQEEFDTALPDGGELANGRRWGPRQFSLPIVINGDTSDDLEKHRRRLMAAFDPDPFADGVFMVAYPGGHRRYLSARYSSGLDVAEIGRAGGPVFRDSYTVIMKARDPFPFTDEVKQPFGTPNGSNFFPLPFTLSPDVTTGDIVINVSSECTIFQTWRLRGPMSTLTLANRDTGKVLQLNVNLLSGQELFIRTNRRVDAAEKITDVAGNNRWEQVVGLDSFPNLWPLEPGENRVTVSGTGTTPASLIELSYRPRFKIA